MPLSAIDKSVAANIKLFRILTTFILLGVIVIGATGAYIILTNIETATTNRQFESYSDQLQAEISKSVDRNIYASNSLSKIYANKCFTDRDWPNCLLDLEYMESVGSDLFRNANIPGFGFSVLISPQEQKQFEKDMYEIFSKLGVSNSSFGWGIYGLSESANTSDLRYPIVNGSFGLEILAPLVQLNNFETLKNVVMYDEYSEYYRYMALNDVRNCSRHKESKRDPCNILSDIITFPSSLTQPVSKLQPKSILFTSVQPTVSNSSEARGVILTGVDWSAVLSNIIPRDILGIKCVIGINYKKYIFKIKKSQGVFIKSVTLKEKLDETTCDKHKHCISLNYFDGDSTYYMWVIKTKDFDAHYETAGPVIASTIFTVMILVLSGIFFAYDMFVNKEILQKEIVLRTKQLFVRYISHEIRTPINTIHIGLSLLMTEVHEVLGKVKAGREDKLLATVSDSNNDSKVPDVASLEYVGNKLFHWLDMIFDIETSSAAAIQVLNDLLDYEQIQISKLNMDMSVVSMWSLCESVFWSFRFNLDAKCIRYNLTMEVGHDSGSYSSGTSKEQSENSEYLRHIVVLGDEKKLEQVMRNLISNAIKFTPPKGDIRVDVSFIPDRPKSSESNKSMSQRGSHRVLPSVPNTGVLKLRVTDTGEGLTEMQQKQLFTEGVQFNPNRLQDGKGSGLGLWITKGIVAEHKGSIEVYSRGLGHGTTFTVQLPCHYDESFKYTPFKKSRKNEASKDISKTLTIKREINVDKILLVDDSVPNVKVCSRLLTNAGYEVDAAYNGEECLQKMESCDYQLIIIDNHMPVMDGPTAVKILRSRGLKLPIVGLTGSITPDEISHFRGAGCDDVLSKPLSIQKLNEVLLGVQVRKTNYDNDKEVQRAACAVDGVLH